MSATTCGLPVGRLVCVRPAGHDDECNRAYPNGSRGPDDGTQVVTQDEWLAEAEALFGSHDNWKFRCPSCGTDSSVADFKALGVDGQRAPFECIGRIHKEQGATYHIDGDTKPCNWAANGLIILGNLTEVVYRDSAKTTFVFPFAEPGATQEGTDR